MGVTRKIAKGKGTRKLEPISAGGGSDSILRTTVGDLDTDDWTIQPTAGNSEAHLLNAAAVAHTTSLGQAPPESLTPQSSTTGKRCEAACLLLDSCVLSKPDCAIATRCQHQTTFPDLNQISYRINMTQKFE